MMVTVNTSEQGIPVASSVLQAPRFLPPSLSPVPFVDSSSSA